MTRLTAVCQTVVGGGSLSAGISPAELSSCHSATTATGLISRYQPRCRRRRRAAVARRPGVRPVDRGAREHGGLVAAFLERGEARVGGFRHGRTSEGA